MKPITALILALLAVPGFADDHSEPATLGNRLLSSGFATTKKANPSQTCATGTKTLMFCRTK